jgi:enoyl-CoA hydratase/carnithine racemase
MNDRVRVEKKDGIAEVRMCRTDKLNALDAAMFAALIDAGAELAHDRGLRAVVLAGEGRAFSAGLDFPSFMAPGEDGEVVDLLARDGESLANRAQRASWVWQELPVPVIAAVHGVAYGGGLQIALGADIRIVAPDARLSLREAVFGLVPDMAVTQTLRHGIRPDVAKELTFTARIVSGEEAVGLGLATRVHDEPLEAARELAQEIAARSPDAVRATKRLWNEALDGTVAEGLLLEEELPRKLLGGKNQAEAVQASFQKREPRFGDPELD